MKKSDSVIKLAAALAKAQAEMPAVKMNAVNPFLRNKYADLGAVIETSRPILAKHGLAIVQTVIGDGVQIGVTTMLAHESGEWLEDTITLSLGEEKGKSSAQVAGSIISYLRRYSWASVLGLYADEDTDGNQAQPKPAAKSEPKPAQPAAPKVANETITDSEWQTFCELGQTATAMGINLPEYDRSKMTASTMNGASEYIKSQIKKRENK